MSTPPPGPIRANSSAPARAPVVSRRGAAVALGAALVLGATLGWLAHARWAAPADGPAPAAARADPVPQSPGERVGAEDAEGVARFWSALAWSMASRSADLEGLLEAARAEAGDPRASLERAIAASSDRELAAIVAAVTQIDENDLLGDGDLRPFASRLVDVALDGLEGPSNEPPPDDRVFFASTTRDFDPDATARDAFPSDHGRIFAMIDLARHDADRVMVKWLNTDTRRIHSLQTMTREDGRPLWSYLSRADDWAPGRYEVSFYSQDAQMRLLGRGTFTVVPARTTDPPPDPT